MTTTIYRNTSAYSAILLIVLWCAAAGAARAQEQTGPYLAHHQPPVLLGFNERGPSVLAQLSVASSAEAVIGCANPVACENILPGTPPSDWRITEPGDASIMGFATEQSVNVGGTIAFKIKTNATAYHIDILRAGWYQGLGARKVVPNLRPSVGLPQSQPACIVYNNGTGLIDCGNWAVSASWTVPADATSGVYFARLVREDTNGSSYIFFNVRNDLSHSDIVYQTSDTTRTAYNTYGGNSLYQCQVNCPPGTPNQYKGAAKVSFNRPNNATLQGPHYSFFGAEFQLVQFLEANGYDVSYISGVDTHRASGPLSGLLTNHRLFISSGQDEYWSGPQRANVEAARDAKPPLNLAFFSGNEVFWKTRYEDSSYGAIKADRTLVCYKETHFDKPVDPLDPPNWTGTWRDTRFSPPADGGRPENALTGTLYAVDEPANFSIKVPAADGKMRFWRKTSVATLAPGQTAVLPLNTLGYEWDEDADNGARPAGIVHLSTTTENVPHRVLDKYGSAAEGPGAATHHLVLHRAPSGALVFGAGTVQWSWGLSGSVADPRMQQATVNLLADMGVQPATLLSTLTPASASSDTTAPTSVITSPSASASVQAGSTVLIIGTASDSGGVVGGVEVSTDSGVSWHPATGRENWTYQWTPISTGTFTLRSRAVDDSANLEAPSNGVPVTVTGRTCPCTIWPATAVPAATADTDNNAVELGVKFYADSSGFINGIRFYKAPSNIGPHVASLWTANGTLLASVPFTGESASGWQQVNFTSPVAINAGTHYVASYHTQSGHYAGDTGYFAASAFDNAPLHALQNGADGGNGVYTYSTDSAFPAGTFQSSNYWVDVVFTPTGGGGDNTPPSVISRSPAINATGVPVGTTVTATFSESVSNISFVLKDPGGTTILAATSYNASTFTATLTPSASLAPSTTYTATVSGAKDAAGNVMTTVSWSFTTGGAGQVNCPCSIWSLSASPGVAAEPDSNPVELGVKFRADVNGTITGIRYFKSSTNTGTHIATLWDLSGNALARATFSNETASGWQQVNFAPPVAITAGTIYIASYHTNTGHYADDSGYFVRAVDNGPLHALQDGAQGPNGVYAYGGPGSVFPTAGWQGSNYWVDVIFQRSP